MQTYPHILLLTSRHSTDTDDQATAPALRTGHVKGHIYIILLHRLIRWPFANVVHKSSLFHQIGGSRLAQYAPELNLSRVHPSALIYYRSHASGLMQSEGFHACQKSFLIVFPNQTSDLSSASLYRSKRSVSTSNHDSKTLDTLKLSINVNQYLTLRKRNRIEFYQHLGSV